MMRQNFSVRVLNGKNNPAEETSEGYVPLQNGEQYSLVLKNNNNFDAIAAIKIDGKDVAHVKVPKNDRVTVDAPFDSDKKFTFYKKKSKEGKALSLEEIGRDDLGLIQVSFMQVGPEVTFTPQYFNTKLVYVPTYPWWWDFHWWRPSITFTTIAPIEPMTINMGGSSGTGGGANTVLTSSVQAVNHAGSLSITNGVQSQMSFTTGKAHSDHGISNHSVFLNSVAPGGTGLSGEAEHLPKDVEKSRQEFHQKYKQEDVLVLSLRLVWKKTKGTIGPAKLCGYSNPVPAPI